tara:strand:+ start:847 stop:1194 length:348 start_codon:yes stop_codon:yes gene_type:complete
MKKLATLILGMALTIGLPAYANTDITPKEMHIEEKVESQGGDIHVSVNGLVCDFCARALEKVFGKEEAVQNIDVNLDTKVITITLNEDKNITDERIKALIADSGYNVEGIHRVKK